MEKKGKVDILSVLIASILIFVVYAVFVLGGLATISQNFPVNQTNASATAGTADTAAAVMKSFNSSPLALFQCNITINSTKGTGGNDLAFNLSNVSLFIQKGSAGTRETANRNATINGTGDGHDTFVSNETGILLINFTNQSTKNEFDEGEYFWFCEAMLISSGLASTP